MDDIIVFTEEELILLEDANDFSKFLYSMHEEYEIYEVTEMYEFYLEIGWLEHCIVLLNFEKNIINGEG
jgi:hypothetical protein